MKCVNGTETVSARTSNPILDIRCTRLLLRSVKEKQSFAKLHDFILNTENMHDFIHIINVYIVQKLVSYKYFPLFYEFEMVTVEED